MAAFKPIKLSDPFEDPTPLDAQALLFQKYRVLPLSSKYLFFKLDFMIRPFLSRKPLAEDDGMVVL